MMRRIFSLLLLWSGLAATAFAQAAAVRHQPVLDLGSMDTSADPCADFYAYSCGGWLKNNPIPVDQTSWSVYSKLQDETRLVLRDILGSAASPSASRSPVTQKIGDYYAACM